MSASQPALFILKHSVGCKGDRKVTGWSKHGFKYVQVRSVTIFRDKWWSFRLLKCCDTLVNQGLSL